MSAAHRLINLNDNSSSSTLTRILLTDDTGVTHEFVQSGTRWRADNQEGICASLVIPDLDMVDTQHTAGDNKQVGNCKYLFLPFSHPHCDDASLTGGKGSSLGLISVCVG